MCIRTAIHASSLCLLPSVVGFGAGTLSVQQPRLFLAALVLSLVVGAAVALRTYTRTGKGARATEVEEVEVAAGALLGISFLFSFWTGLAWIGGLGILSAGIIVSVSTALLAAFTLTFVRQVIDRKVPWLENIIARIQPVDGGLASAP